MSGFNGAFGQKTVEGLAIPLTAAGLAITSGTLAAFNAFVGGCVMNVFGISTPVWLSTASSFLGGVIMGVPLILCGIGFSLLHQGQNTSFSSSFTRDMLAAFFAGAVGSLLMGGTPLPIMVGTAMFNAMKYAVQ